MIRGQRRGARFGVLLAGALSASLILFVPPIPSEVPFVAGAAASLSAPETPPAHPRPAPPATAADAPAPAAAGNADASSPVAPPPQGSPSAEAAPHPVQLTRTVAAQPGDTALKLLGRLGIADEDIRAATKTIGRVWDLRELRIGQKVTLSVADGRLHSIRVALAPDREIAAARDDTGAFVAEDQTRPTHTERAFGAGRIVGSLSAAATRVGIPPGVVDEMTRAFSYDVDFQREVRAGDTFKLLYDRVYDEFGKPTAIGHVVYAEMVLHGKQLRFYRFTPRNGDAEFFDAAGHNVKKALLRTPIDGARITSGFGMRLHPILGYTRMHRGVDFGAPTGTRVYAAGDGVVAKIGPVSGYGNYIEIDHNREYATAYGHLSAFAPGLHEGQHVHQGDVIGFVGMTGLATGPHLHYEVHYDGAQIDPLSVKMPVMTRLAGGDLKAFEALRRSIDAELAHHLLGPQIARAGHGDSRRHAVSAP